MVVNDYLESQFASIIDYHFTANVEQEFDRVADGDITWHTMISDFYAPFHKLVDSAIGTQSDRTQQVRVLGVDPKTGYTVKARIGRYGPMVELGGTEEQKGQFASLKKGQLIESITLEEALELFALPRNLGELNGEALMVGVGKFGPYLRHGKTFTSLAKSDDPYTITRERAEELLRENGEKQRAQSEPLKTFAEDANMLIKSGIYGPYISYNGKNYRLPRGSKPESLSYVDCQRIVAKAKK
jgi:DNA topoisomerase-1